MVRLMMDMDFNPRIGSITVPFVELGETISLSVNAPEEARAIVKDLLRNKRYGVFDIFNHLPDAIVGTPPTIQEAPIVDRLQKITGFGAYARFASPLYEYWTGYAKSKADEQTNNAINKVFMQSRKSWWTKLCWKLGGFSAKTTWEK